MRMHVDFYCYQCSTRIRVRGTRSELGLIRDAEDHKCPRCNLGICEVDTQFSSRPDISLSIDEFWRAVSGGGLPDELVTHRETLEALLLASRIVKTDISEIDGRCIIDRLHLENGVVIHLGASGYGAIAVKVTRSGDANRSGTDTGPDKPKSDTGSEEAT